MIYLTILKILKEQILKVKRKKILAIFQFMLKFMRLIKLSIKTI